MKNGDLTRKKESQNKKNYYLLYSLRLNKLTVQSKLFLVNEFAYTAQETQNIQLAIPPKKVSIPIVIVNVQDQLIRNRTLQQKQCSSVQDATINAPNKYVNALKVPKQITKPILKFDMIASTKSRANGEMKWLIPNCIGQIKVKLAQNSRSQYHILSYKCCMLCSSLQSKTNNRAYRKNNNKQVYLCAQTFFVYPSQFIQASLFYSNLTQN
ncbi:unnamed protein product [Paramecium octaurelia]|uniref:Uncharacterized protein n=1 Tax=Paramecium octaurelia TaxID=43137 RepID=A0A8S1S0B7_PAROT|nr:unnamed protein product [Paramecium octaurelia]